MLQGLALFLVTAAAVVLVGVLWTVVYVAMSLLHPGLWFLFWILAVPLTVLLLVGPGARLGYQAGRRTGWGWLGGLVVGAEASALWICSVLFCHSGWQAAVFAVGVSLGSATLGGFRASLSISEDPEPAAADPPTQADGQ